MSLPIRVPAPLTDQSRYAQTLEGRRFFGRLLGHGVSAEEIANRQVSDKNAKKLAGLATSAGDPNALDTADVADQPAKLSDDKIGDQAARLEKAAAALKAPSLSATDFRHAVQTIDKTLKRV